MSSTDRRQPLGMLQLRCRNCGQDLSGLHTDVIFLCGNCGRCWVLDRELKGMEIAFVGAEGPESLLLPFWKVDAVVSIYRRVSRSESTASIIEGFKTFTGRERGLLDTEPETRKARFIFPAFSTSLVLSTGVRMYRENFLPDRVQHGTEFKMPGGSVGPEDAVALTRGVAVGVEVNRSDFLACVDLDTEVSDLCIYAIACSAEEHVLRIGDSDIKLPYSAVRDSDDILGNRRTV